MLRITLYRQNKTGFHNRQPRTDNHPLQGRCLGLQRYQTSPDSQQRRSEQQNIITDIQQTGGRGFQYTLHKTATAF